MIHLPGRLDYLTLIFGFGYQYNTLTKNEVKNGSILLSADYLLPDKDLLIGIEYVTNLPRLNEEPTSSINQFSVLQGYLYNHNIISIKTRTFIWSKISFNRFFRY